MYRSDKILISFSALGIRNRNIIIYSLLASYTQAHTRNAHKHTHNTYTTHTQHTHAHKHTHAAHTTHTQHTHTQHRRTHTHPHTHTHNHASVMLCCRFQMCGYDTQLMQVIARNLSELRIHYSEYFNRIRSQTQNSNTHNEEGMKD